jgi:hypothetical protein
MSTNRFSGVFRASYTSTVPFNDSTYDANDLARVTYLPLDSSGKFSEIPFKVFTARQCQPLVILGGNQALTNLERSFRNNFSLSRYPDCSTIKIYRPLAITWKLLKSLKIKPPSVTDEFEVVVEHSDKERYSEDDEIIMFTYQESLMDNIRFAFMNASLQLQLRAIGDFKRPDQSPINPMLLNYDTYNFTTFDWLKNSNLDLTDWSKTLLHDSKITIFNYLDDLKTSLQRFRINSRIDDTELWCEKMEKTQEYVDILREYVEMISIVLDVTKHVAETIWDKYAVTQIDLTQLITKIIEM